MIFFLYKEYGWQLYILMRTVTEIRHTLQKERPDTKWCFQSLRRESTQSEKFLLTQLMVS